MGEAVQFDAMDLPRQLAALRRDYDANSAVALGERIAAGINAQSETALRDHAQRGASGKDLELAADLLLAAEEALRTRLELVQCAMARLLTVSGD